MRTLTLALLTVACALGAGELSGRRAPGFALPEVSARMHDTQDYRGKILIVDFMQTSCAHCVKFSAILEQAKAKYGDKIAVLSVVNPPSDQKSVTAFIAQNKTKTPILFDCGQVAFSYLKPTGTQITIGNLALRDSLIRRNRDKFTTIPVTDVTGKTIDVQVAKIGELQLGPVTLRDVPMAFADMLPFKLFGLADGPALLLGTDILENFQRVSLDFRARKVRFQLRRCSDGVVLSTSTTGSYTRISTLRSAETTCR